MSCLLITHEACQWHETPKGHVESPARLQFILRALAPLKLPRHDASMIAPEHLRLVHTDAYINGIIQQLSEQDEGVIDANEDIFFSPGTHEAALRAAGAGIDAVNVVLSGQYNRVFCAVRPPGHHAEPDRAMGFCYFANAAIAAAYALTKPGIERVAVIDFDVHHGNGTEVWARTEPRAFFASSQQMPLYPGTGDPADHGPHNNICNMALAAGDGRVQFRAVWQKALARLAQFKPDIIFISAGFDAHEADPLAQINLSENDYSWITAQLVQIAQQHAQGRVISLLEGGYDVEALARSVVAHVEVLMGQNTLAPNAVSA